MIKQRFFFGIRMYNKQLKDVEKFQTSVIFCFWRVTQLGLNSWSVFLHFETTPFSNMSLLATGLVNRS